VLDGGDLTIAIGSGQLGPDVHGMAPRPRRRRRLKRILIITGSAFVALLAVAASWVGISIYRIDHAVHHVGVPASLLAKGKNDLLAIVKGPNHSEQIFVFHASGGHTKVLKIPNGLGLPLAGGDTVPIRTLSLHAPTAIIAGLKVCATLNIILLVRRCSTKACSWFFRYSVCCPARRGMGENPR